MSINTATGSTIKSDPAPVGAGEYARGWRPRLVDAAALSCALLIALTALLPAYDEMQLALSGGVAVLVGTGLAIVGTRFGWGSLLLVAVVVLSYLLFFGAQVAPKEMIAGVIPSPAALQALALAAVRSWQDALTLAPPFDVRPELTAVPVLLGLVGSVVAVSFAMRLRRWALTLLPLGVVVVAAVLFGTSDAAFPLQRGIALASVVIGWCVWRWRSAIGARSSAGDTAAPDRQLLAIGIVALCVAGGGVLGTYSQPEVPRYVLRDYVVPPFDLRDYVSPLQSYRGLVRDYEDEVLLTVSELPAGARVRLAAMDGYDGMVYDVTEGAGSAAFVSATSELPPSQSPVEGTEAAVEITIVGYTGVWIPVLDQPGSVEFATENASEQERGLYVDTESGVVLTTVGVGPGDTYTTTGTIPVVPTDEQLAGKSVLEVAQPPVEAVPSIVASTASEMVSTDGEPATLLRELQTALSTTGFFSHGLEGEAPSRSGHGAERIGRFLVEEQLVGDDEQYAVTMALMARQLGFPARVVMGWYPDSATSGEVELTGSDLRVWTEIAFEGYGWVAYDPTPPEDQVPQDSESDPRSNPQPQVLQPPPPPEEPVDEPPVSADDESRADEEEDEDAEAARLGPLVIAGIAFGAGLLLLLIPIAAVLAAKARRRARRSRRPQPVDRVSGGWSEVLDAATDLGISVPPSATRRQSAAVLSQRFGSAGVVLLADRADGYVFGPGEPTEAEAREVWGDVHGVVGELRSQVGWWARLKARISLRSLRADRAERNATRNASLDGERRKGKVRT